MEFPFSILLDIIFTTFFILSLDTFFNISSILDISQPDFKSILTSFENNLSSLSLSFFLLKIDFIFLIEIIFICPIQYYHLHLLILI